MSLGNFKIPRPDNEAIRPYRPDDADTASLRAELERQANDVLEVPCVIAGEHVFTGNTVDVTMPCDHQHVIAKVHLAGPDEAGAAVDAAEAARNDWYRLPFEERAAVFLRAAELLAGPWRDRMNAATMLGQGKTCFQAEIDAACELIDFWKFNAWYADQWIHAEQPPVSPRGTWNRMEHRPLDGFVFAIAPFNFTSIALNLPSAPALLGNTTVWKPSLTSSAGIWQGMRILEEAGLPPGVINLVHGHGADVGDTIMARRELAGLHFTGSTATFQHLWRTIGERIDQYGQYPRIVGETGGKDFIVAHASADPEALAVAILRGAYEYQGQKCSAASRMYIPTNLWGEVRDRVVAGIADMKVGDVRDWSTFVAAVIDERAFRKHQRYLGIAHETGNVLAGGTADDSTGWFVDPTLVEVDNPRHQLLREEIFGPIASAYVYDEARFEEVLEQVDSASPYALTGAIFAKDRRAVARAVEGLRFAAGNFYINDKPTGAVVGQQPFGGGRASGTNDKAGSPLNLQRWVSPRSIKETFVPPTDWRYPYLG